MMRKCCDEDEFTGALADPDGPLSGPRVHCGLVFDDVDRMVICPHLPR